MTKLKWDVFRPKFGSWAGKIKPFFMEGGLDEVYAVLKKESGEGIRIVPDSVDVFRCFRECPINELKCVIMGYCPYHTIRNGVSVADGLMSSCGRTRVLQPSLEQIYGAWEEEFNDGLCLECEKEPDLGYLARQGVLLFNSALTTRAGVAGAHQELWEPFTAYILREVVSVTGVPVVLLGQQAREFGGLFPASYPLFELSHPASASYKKEKWNSKGVFGQVNKIIQDANGEEIMWLNMAPF